MGTRKNHHSTVHTAKTVSAHDALRLRLFEARRRGDGPFARERTRAQRQHRLSNAQINAIWARGRGAFQSEFFSRVLDATSPSKRAARRRALTRLCATR